MARLCSLAATSISLLSIAHAGANVTLSLVPASSSLTLGGDVSGSALSPQGAGANVTSYSGSMTISDPGASFSFVSANGDAAISGNWSPLPGGALGTAPADYGLQAPILALTVFGAARNLHVGLTSGALPLAGGNFPASLVTLSLLDGDLDFNAVLQSGTLDLAGMTSVAGNGTGSLVVAGTDATLTIPIDASFQVTAAGLPVNVTVRGTLVARGVVPAPGGVLVLAGVGLVVGRRRR